MSPVPPVCPALAWATANPKLRSTQGRVAEQVGAYLLGTGPGQVPADPGPQVVVAAVGDGPPVGVAQQLPVRRGVALLGVPRKAVGVCGIARQLRCPRRRLTTANDKLSRDRGKPPPRVQAMPDSGLFHHIWCPRGDLNPHRCFHPLAPQASASAYSATRTGADDHVGWLRVANLRLLCEPVRRPRAGPPDPLRQAPQQARSPSEQDPVSPPEQDRHTVHASP